MPLILRSQPMSLILRSAPLGASRRTHTSQSNPPKRSPRFRHCGAAKRNPESMPFGSGAKRVQNKISVERPFK
jgi:hypothetical protein